MEFFRTAAEGETGDFIMRSETFLTLLTEDEFLAMLGSSNQVIIDTVALFQNRNGFVDVTSARFSTVMAEAVSEGHITQARVDALRRGVIST